MIKKIINFINNRAFNLFTKKINIKISQIPTNHEKIKHLTNLLKTEVEKNYTTRKKCELISIWTHENDKVKIEAVLIDSDYSYELTYEI